MFKLQLDKNNCKEQEIEAICNNKVYINELDNSNLLGL